MLERRLCVFFEAAGVRYAAPAVAIVEVARPDIATVQLRHHTLKDLSAHLGGGPEPTRPGAAVLFDTSPTLAVRVARVEGVFDAQGDTALPLSGRLIPLLTPAVRSGLLREGRLYFELDLDGVARGLPRQTRRPERVTRRPQESGLVFESGKERWSVPLSIVRQVIAAGPGFNRAPSPSGFLGAIADGSHLAPVFTVSDASELEALVVLIEVGGEHVGLSAQRAEGVRAAQLLSDIPMLDVEHMFS